MASDSPGDTSVSVNLPESLSRWLDDKASEEGRSREDVLLQLLSAYRKVDGLEDGDVDLPDGMAPEGELPAGLQQEVDDRVAERVDAVLDERLDEREEGDAVDPADLDQRVDTVEARFMELLEDVRDRVIQVKREADEKAPAEHDHPDLVTDEALAELATDVEMTETAVDSLETRMETGFENYEEVLEYLANNIDRVSARQTTLARALLETREELRKLAARDTARSAAESLKREANQQGVSAAACGECDQSVDVGLLTRAECPHCSVPFVGVDPAQGFFGSDTLTPGERPALESGDDPDDGFEHGVDEIIDESESARAGIQEGLDDADDDSEGADGDEAERNPPEGPVEDGADGADGDDGGFEFARGGYTDDGDADAGEGDSDDADAPLGDLAERARRGDVGQDEDVMDAFEEVEVGDVDEDDLWDQLEQERIEETVDEPASDAERDVRVIHKRDYCMRCQYFSAPPEVRCTHEHGEILSLEDTDRFKVADCPILRGEEELENLRR